MPAVSATERSRSSYS